MHNRYPTPQPRTPIGLLLFVTALALLIIAATGAWLAWQFTLLDPTIASVLRVAIYALPILAGAGAGYVGIVAIYNRYARLEIVKADKITALRRAEVQRFPDALTSLSFHDSSKPMLAPPVEPEPLALPEPGAIPSFGQLLDQGAIGAGKPLLLGYNAATGEPIAGTWSKLYSVGIGGMTGSGKSWCAAWLLAQSAAAGAKLIVIDPHAGDDESLSSRLAGLSNAFLCEVAQSGAQIESALKLASRELAQRTAGAPAPYQVILVCDEWTSLLRTKIGDLLTATALDIAEQGRKYGVFGMFCAQAWQVDAAGAVRDRLASHYCLRTRGDQFRYQLGLKGSAPVDSLFLKPGEAYFLSVAGELEKIVIPQMTSADLARIGGTVKPAFGFRPATKTGSLSLPMASGLASTARAPEARWKPGGSGLEAKTNLASTASGSAKPLSPEAAALRAELLAGKTVSEAARERNSGSTSGRAYQAALGDVNDLLRELLGANDHA